MPDLFNAITISDYAKRLTPERALDTQIIESVARSNPILQDMLWIQGNLPTGIQTTQRSSVPEPGIRRINRGVEQAKTTTKQIVDTCCVFETRSLVDTELLALYPQADRAAFRRSEELGFVEGFGQKLAKNVFYGEVDGTQETFNGLSVRYPTVGGVMNEDAGFQVVSNGGTAANQQTSIYIVGWGNLNTAGVYPKHGTAGMTTRDLGECDAFDDDGNRFRALSTLFNWKVGLTVRDIRSNAILRNIDVPMLKSNATTSEDRFNFIQNIIRTKNTIRNLQSGNIRPIMYVSRSVYDFFEIYLHDKGNVTVTRSEHNGAPGLLMFSGIPIKACDEILETEAVFPNT